MDAHESDRRLGVKEARLARFTGFLPYIMLAISTILAVLEELDSVGAGLVTAGLAALTAMFILGWRSLPPAWTDRQALKHLYFVGLLALTAILITRSLGFGFFAWCNYLVVSDLLRGWMRPAGVVAASSLQISTFFGGIPELFRLTPGGYGLFLVFIAATTLLVMVLTHFQEVTDERTENRKLVIAELAEANAKLEAVIRENEGLHAQLVTQAREAGVLDERQRMAREIHDTIAQGLTGIITQVQAARNAADRPEDWGRHLDNAARLARTSLTEARRSVEAVGPEELETARLPEALADVANRWSAISGVPAETASTGTVRPLHPEVEVTLLRAAQEALANVAKHAEASRVGVTLSYMDDVVTLDVLDDGVGFDPAALNGRGTNGIAGGRHTWGFGLTAMRQRVRGLDGQLTIESEAGEGTVVSASVPAVPRGGHGYGDHQREGKDA